MASETKIVITAATAQAEASLAKLGQSIGGVSRQMFDLSGISGTLGGALSITAFAAYSKSIIDAADNLNDMSVRTGVAVKDLASLQLAAEQSGTNLENVGKAISRLNLSFGQGAQGNKAASEALERLGITSTDARERLFQLADAYVKTGGSTATLADMQAVLGKSYADMLPLLSQGAEGLRDMVAESGDFAEQMAKLAPDADKFNDQLSLLKTNIAGVAASILSEAVPSFNEWIAVGKEVIKTGTLLDKVRFFALGNASDEMVGKVRAEEAARAADEAARKVKMLERRESAQAKQIKVPSTARIKTDPNASAVFSIQNDEFRKQMELLGVSTEQVKVYELAMKGATKAQIERAQASADSIGAINAQIQADKDLLKSEEDANNKMQQSALEAQRIIFDIDPIAKASAEWEKLLALKEKGLLTDEQIAASYAKNFGESVDDMTVHSKRFAENVQRNMGDVLYDGLNGKFEDIGDVFKQMLTRMAADAAAANLARAMFGNAAQSGEIGGLAGDLISSIGGFFGGGASSSSGFVDVGGFGNLFPSANGNVFAGPGISAYSGSIVDKPTIFPFARGTGLMGEAGPEAILPLTRINGKLGVQAQGGSKPSINLTNSSVINIDSRTDRAEVAQLVTRAVEQGNAMLVDRLQRSGALA